MGGDGGIGKTTLAKVFCDSPFVDSITTIGVDIHVKNVEIDGKPGLLQIWDLSGQEQFRFMLPDFFRNSNGIILGFDVHRIPSFHALGKWITMFKLSQPQTPIFLIGTKIDLGYHPALNREMVMSYVKEFNLVGYAEVSAKANLNIELPFLRILEHIKGFEPGNIPILFLSNKNKEETTPVAIDLEKPSETLEITSETIEILPAISPPAEPEQSISWAIPPSNFSVNQPPSAPKVVASLDASLLRENNPPQNKPPQTYPPQIEPPQIYHPQNNPPQNKPPQTYPPQNNPPQIEPPQIYHPQIYPPPNNPPQILKSEPVLTLCPHCNSSLRESQISLKQRGMKVMCHNCFKFI